MWSTIIITAIVAIVFIAIIARGIYHKKKGKSCCACAGSCGGCALNGSCYQSD